MVVVAVEAVAVVGPTATTQDGMITSPIMDVIISSVMDVVVATHLMGVVNSLVARGAGISLVALILTMLRMFNTLLLGRINIVRTRNIIYTVLQLKCHFEIN